MTTYVVHCPRCGKALKLVANDPWRYTDWECLNCRNCRIAIYVALDPGRAMIRAQTKDLFKKPDPEAAPDG